MVNEGSLWWDNVRPKQKGVRTKILLRNHLEETIAALEALGKWFPYGLRNKVHVG
jgi:hypothetical protein